MCSYLLHKYLIFQEYRIYADSLTAVRISFGKKYRNWTKIVDLSSELWYTILRYLIGG